MAGATGNNILADAILVLGNILVVLILVRAILSWFPEPQEEGLLRDLYYGVLKLVNTVVGPIMEPIRNLIQKSPLGESGGMMIDFSPIIAFFLIRMITPILAAFANALF